MKNPRKKPRRPNQEPDGPVDDPLTLILRQAVALAEDPALRKGFQDLLEKGESASGEVPSRDTQGGTGGKKSRGRLRPPRGPM
jgi:hypothetical protein